MDQTITRDTILDCGHVPSQPEFDDTERTGTGSTGFGVNRATGARSCYDCCAIQTRDEMTKDGTAVLYLSYSKDPECRGLVVAVTDWAGRLRLPVVKVTRSLYRGFGLFPVERIDVRFIGPDGAVWYGKHQGGNDIVRCRRTKLRLGK